ncbi:MAG: HIT family protein [Pseudomonadota bacterium]
MSPRQTCYRFVMGEFDLHPQLVADTHEIGSIGLNKLLLMDDKRFPWVIMVPQRANLRELHEMSPMDQAMMTFEMTQVAEALQRKTGCHKVNVAALGNEVPQLHMHVIARYEHDAAWPNPVWGNGRRVPYVNGDAGHFIEDFTQNL